jgi:Family of unknown function (DUF6055)
MRAPRQIGTSLLLAGLLLGMTGAASASAAGATPLSNRDATEALHRATRLLEAPGSHTSAAGKQKQLTTTLLALSRSLNSLEPAQRRHAEALLARPTDSPDPDGSAYAVKEQPPLCSAHFCVHYVASTVDAPDLSDGNGNGIPDYVEQVSATSEAVYAVENGVLGWKPARSDRKRGGDPRVDVYLVQLRGEIFGYSAPDVGQTKRSQSAYVVIDDDYAVSEFPRTNPLTDLQVTLAHEYNHVLQFGYDVQQDLWFYESSAVWIEDYVYPVLDDYLRYMKRWSVRSEVPLTTENIKIYGSAVWNHWLAGRYGADIVRTAWAQAKAVKPFGFSISAFNRAIKSAAAKLGRAVSGKDLPHEFARFATATAEWRTPSVFPYADAPLWPDVQRRGQLRPNRFLTRSIDHTGYLLLNVEPRNVGSMRLLAGAERGTAAAFALICREGPVETGLVTIKIRYAGRGGVRGVTLQDPGRCDRITAALISADTGQRGFAFGDWNYTGNNRRFAATLLLRG